MSNSSLVDIKVPAYSGNYSKGRSGKKIKKITLHHMAGVLSASQCGNIFKQVGRLASSNYGIGNDGKIALYVDEENRPYTSSNKANDLEAVTIEISNCERGGQWRVSDVALNRTIDLCVDICKRNDIKKLILKETLTWHSMFVATTCPGPYLLSKMQYIADTVNARLGSNNVVNNTTSRKVGDVVTINGVYTSSTSTNKLSPAVKTGTITKIIPNARNPYLLNNGNIGWVNDGCIVSGQAKPVSNNNVIKAGNKVKVKQGAKSYKGVSLASFVYNTVYDVIEVKGDRAVIGKGKVVTTDINVKDLYNV